MNASYFQCQANQDSKDGHSSFRLVSFLDQPDEDRSRVHTHSADRLGSGKRSPQCRVTDFSDCRYVIGAAIAVERYEVAVILSVLNLITLKALLPFKHRLDNTAPSLEEKEK